MDQYFITPEHGGKVILLIDASGSVLGKYGTTTIFDAMCDKIVGILNKNSVEQFKVLFWNSTEGFDGLGVIDYPHFVNGQKLRDIMNMLIKPKINSGCLTYTWLAFDKLPKTWMTNNEVINLYLVTDGQIGWNIMAESSKKTCYRKLSTSIKQLLDEYRNLQLHIVTVENIVRDMTNLEQVEKAAGSDVFNVVRDFSDCIASFISFTPNCDDGFVHYRNMRCPAGHAPFGNRYFGLRNVAQFYNWLKEVILETKDNEKLYDIVNNLVKTLQVLVRDKHSSVGDKIVDSYCRLFSGTGLDPLMVSFVLKDAIKREREGKIEIVAEFRNRVKGLFKEADRLLKENVRGSIGIAGGNVMSLILGNKILLCPKKMMCYDFYGHGFGAVELDDKFVPMLPVGVIESEMAEQCVRQWTRFVVARMYGCDIRGDRVVYIVLGMMLQVCLSDSDDEVKNGYRRLGQIMLGKKRLTSDISEIDYLRQGNLLTDDGFLPGLRTINNDLGLKLKMMSIWWLICLVLNDDKIIKSQYVHCEEDIRADFPQGGDLLVQVEIGKIDTVVVPEEHGFEYICVVTLEDTEKGGGYVIKQHGNCIPNQVLSDSGYSDFMAGQYRVCPICYCELAEGDFRKVGPKPTLELKFESGVRGVYNNNRQIQVVKPSVVENDARQKYIIAMRGTVGSGKSTASVEIKKQIDHDNVLICSMDKYLKLGYSPGQAAETIKLDIQKFIVNDCSSLVIVLDTCNEKGVRVNNVFGIDLTGWKLIVFDVNRYKQPKSNIQDYLSWSLYNVLNRNHADENSMYSLNPIDAGVDVCIAVHKRKAEPIFGKKQVKLHTDLPNNIEAAKDKLREGYERYAKYLEGFDLNTEIANLLSRNGIISQR